MKSKIFIFIIAGVVLIASLAYFIINYRSINGNKLYLKLADKEISLIKAETQEARVRGLSGMESLSDDQAMLFVFDKPDFYGIWMKDMKFPIDIIWLDENYKIVHMEEGISPLTYPKVFVPLEKSFYILETNAGFTQENTLFSGKILNFIKK